MPKCEEYFNINNCGPVLYFTLQSFLIGSSVNICRQQLLEMNIIATIFWVDLIIMNSLYLTTFCRDPGFVTLTDLQYIRSSQILEQNVKNNCIDEEDVELTGSQSIDNNQNQTSSPLRQNNMNISSNQQSINIPQINAQQGIQGDFVQQRFCNECNQDQILRSKHCFSCKKCVACYDHHCPWVGNCIGEKNSFTFYWFIFFQLIQGTIISFELYNTITWTQKYFSDNLYLIVVVLCIGYLYIMVCSLYVAHTYLVFANLTQWEAILWGRISYLKSLKRKQGSPFSKGLLGNLRLFCRFRIHRITNWELNQNNQ